LLLFERAALQAMQLFWSRKPQGPHVFERILFGGGGCLLFCVVSYPPHSLRFFAMLLRKSGGFATRLSCPSPQVREFQHDRRLGQVRHRCQEQEEGTSTQPQKHVDTLLLSPWCSRIRGSLSSREHPGPSSRGDGSLWRKRTSLTHPDRWARAVRCCA